MTHNLRSHVFRAYDIRGLADSEIHPLFAYNLGRALSAFWEKNPNTKNLDRSVCVGFDARLHSPDLATALLTGFSSCGWTTFTAGLVPTPVLYFSTVQNTTPFGVMVTGSHNPKEFNGFKMGFQGQTLSADAIQELYQWMSTHWAPSFENKAIHERIPRAQQYIDHLFRQYQEHSKGTSNRLKIVVDSGNGAGGPVSTELFSKLLHHNIVPLFDRPDGNFPNHHPDPSEPHNLIDLKNKVRAENAAFGIAFDGDADRIGVILSDGTVLFGDQLLTLFALDILENKPGATIITEVKASSSFFELVEKKGGRPVMWKTGHSLIKEKMKETGAALAGEMSGHIFFADHYFGYDDAIYSALRLVLWAEKKGNSLTQFVKSLTK